MIEAGVAHALGTLLAAAGRTITYRRGAEAVLFKAAPGRTEEPTDEASGATVRYRSRDFLCRAGDLVLGGAAVLPQEGDKIEEAIGDETVLFEVYAPDGQHCYLQPDPGRTWLRIHTAQVGTL